MEFNQKFAPSANGLPFGRNVHAAILSSIPETIGSYMRYRQQVHGGEIENGYQVRSLWVNPICILRRIKGDL